MDKQESEVKIQWANLAKMGKAKWQRGLGFRDLETFNKALLAKHCWRILQNPESLAAKILKVKYFSRDSILDAKLGNRPSYVWRTIGPARGLLKRAFNEELGMEKNIKIWKDRRIPNSTSLLVQRQGVC